jgi:hypothetical protein
MKEHGIPISPDQSAEELEAEVEDAIRDFS